MADWENGTIGLSDEQKDMVEKSKTPRQPAQALQGSILDEHVKKLLETDDPELAKKLYSATTGVYTDRTG